MNTGCVRISLILAVLAVASGCASQGPQPILSAKELDSMIRVEVRLIEPAPETVIAANDQP